MSANLARWFECAICASLGRVSAAWLLELRNREGQRGDAL